MHKCITRRSNKCNGKREMFSEEGQLVMEDIHVLPFGPFEWQNNM